MVDARQPVDDQGRSTTLFPPLLSGEVNRPAKNRRRPGSPASLRICALRQGARRDLQ